MHAQPAEELVAARHDGCEFVVRSYIFGRDPVVIWQLVLLRTAGFALFATDAKGCVI
jgi:hypothetical protein